MGVVVKPQFFSGSFQRSVQSPEGYAGQLSGSKQVDIDKADAGAREAFLLEEIQEFALRNNGS